MDKTYKIGSSIFFVFVFVLIIILFFLFSNIAKAQGYPDPLVFEVTLDEYKQAPDVIYCSMYDGYPYDPQYGYVYYITFYKQNQGQDLATDKGISYYGYNYNISSTPTPYQLVYDQNGNLFEGSVLTYSDCEGKTLSDLVYSGNAYYFHNNSTTTATGMENVIIKFDEFIKVIILFFSVFIFLGLGISLFYLLRPKW